MDRLLQCSLHLSFLVFSSVPPALGWLEQSGAGPAFTTAAPVCP